MRMKRDHILNPDDFDSVEGKLRAVNGSLEGLLDGTEAYRLRRDATEWMAAITSSLIILHQVVEGMLKDEL